MQYVVKLSTPWQHDFLRRTPGGAGIFENYKFEIDNTCSECDYWIVWGGLRSITKVKCPPQNIIYVTDESHAERRFNIDFLNQFAAVIACRKDLEHQNTISSHDLGMWHFNRSYEQVATMDVPAKLKDISVVSSDLTVLPGHKRRYAFVHQLMGHFKDRMDYFGRGINPIDDKWSSIADYKYSVAVENSFIPGYFTEKIFECFLTNTFPIYYGCPDLDQYFDDRSFIRIDVNDYRAALSKIEDVLQSDLYQERKQFLLEAGKLYLNKYYFFPSMVSVLKNNQMLKENKPNKNNTLYPEAHFRLPSLRKLYHELKHQIER